MERLRTAIAALLLALCGGASALPPAGEAQAPRVASIELRLAPGEDAAALAGLVALSKGEPLGTRALRRTVQRLFQTGRFRNVVVRAVPVPEPPGHVAVVIECLPLRVVAAVNVAVKGEPRVLDDKAVRAASGLDPGEPFDAAALAAAVEGVRAAYARRGWRDAAVETATRGDTQVTVDLEIRPGEPTRISEVRILGDAGPAARIAAGLRTRPGAILDEDALAEDVRALRAELWKQGYRRARVGAPVARAARSGRVAEVELSVEAGPLVVFAFRGNTVVPSAQLARQLGIEEGEPVDVPALDAAAERLRAYYRVRGFAAVTVEVAAVPVPGGVAEVFTVGEGRRYRIRDVALEGPAAPEKLRARLLAALDDEGGGVPPDPPEEEAARLLVLSVPGARPRPRLPAALAPSETWDETAWDRAAQRLADELRADGWLEAAALGGSISMDAARGVVDVTVRLHEGPRTTVDSIAFEGNEAVSVAELAKQARLAPGEPLSFEKVEATRVALLRLYLSRGHVYARVEVRANPDATRHAAAIRYLIEEGPQVHVGRILITGNKRTREDVVVRALSVEEGEVYDPEDVAKSQAALLRLGVFRSVNLTLQEPESPDATKDLQVELVERPWQTIASGLGFSLANGPRAFVEYGRPNLFGRAIELSTRAKVNYPLAKVNPALEGMPPGERIEGRAEVGLRQPRGQELPFPLALRADLVAERLHRLAYDLGRVSGIVGVDVELTSRVTASLQYELEVDDITRYAAESLSREDIERLRFGEGVTTLNSLRPSIALDYRDNAIHPHSGWFAAAAVEFAHSLGEPGGHVLGFLPGSEIYTNMLKLSTTLSGYLPVGPVSVLAFSVRGGRVVPLDEDSSTPVPKRFFMGGATTMRGFQEDQMIPEDLRPALHEQARLCGGSLTGLGCTSVGRALVGGDMPLSDGGQAFLLLKGELRVKVRGSLEAGFFADVGNLWYLPENFDLLQLRWNVGVGIRFTTPIGPAALDFGFNLEPDDFLNERLWAPHFAIGLF
jgi:outer membrane protein assembly complex protein YaeT